MALRKPKSKFAVKLSRLRKERAANKKVVRKAVAEEKAAKRRALKSVKSVSSKEGLRRLVKVMDRMGSKRRLSKEKIALQLTEAVRNLAIKRALVGMGIIDKPTINRLQELNRKQESRIEMIEDWGHSAWRMDTVVHTVIEERQKLLGGLLRTTLFHAKTQYFESKFTNILEKLSEEAALNKKPE